jgi:hypothetical protein
MRPPQRWMALALTAWAATGCQGEATLTAEDLPRIVLQPSDLPPGFGQFDEGRITSLDLGSGPRSDPNRFGRVDGWKARYRRAGGTVSTAGPLVVESTADVFEEQAGAERDLEAFRAETRSAVRDGDGPAQELPAPEIGDETVAVRRRQGDLQPVLYYTVTWRWSNATGTITVSGFGGRVSLSDAAELARAQAERFRAAAED